MGRIVWLACLQASSISLALCHAHYTRIKVASRLLLLRFIPYSVAVSSPKAILNVWSWKTRTISWMC
jgi:hypothetical protein